MYLEYYKATEDNTITLTGSSNSTVFNQNALVGACQIGDDIKTSDTVELKINTTDDSNITFSITPQNAISAGTQLLLFSLDIGNKTGTMRTFIQPTTWA